MSEQEVDEPRPRETKSRKMVRRTVAVSLGIICILLIASLGGIMAYYTMKLNDKENEINSANDAISRLNAAMANENITLISSNANITNLTKEENQLLTWLNGNVSLLGQTQAWLDGNVSLFDQAQAWLSGNSTSYEGQISSLNSQIAQLKSWLSGNITVYQNEIALYNNEVNQYGNYVVDHHHTDEDYNATSSQNTNLKNITDLADSVILENNDSIQQAAGQFTNWTESIDYAGYVSVLVQNSNVTSVDVAVAYLAYGTSFSQEPPAVNVGGTAIFPVLPSNITIFVGNSNLGFEGGASETITITYFY
jgi:hypothetical protein